MKFHLFQESNPDKLGTDCIVVGIHEKGKLYPAAEKLDRACNGMIRQLLREAETTDKLAETLLLQPLPGIAAKRVLLVSFGKEKEQGIALPDYRKAIQAAVNLAKQTGAANTHFYLTEVKVNLPAGSNILRHLIEVLASAFYRFDLYKSEKPSLTKLKNLFLAIPEKTVPAKAEQTLQEAMAIHAGMSFTRDLANQPANICSPVWLANQAVKFGEAANIKVRVLEKEDMKKLGMGAFLAVASGSARDPKLVLLEYKGNSRKMANNSPIALVGKGITFDTGGLSLKPAESMVGMKYDMCGAAAVLGTLKAIAELELPLHVVGALAIAENMPGGKASRPEDIVTTLSGQTVEILNTDAEGRLVLCDALTYVIREYQPATVIDIATLTGAVVIALGQHATGLLANHQPLADALLAAGQKTHDRAWQLPLWEEYQEQLKSPFADMSNVGGRPAGTVTAACFLSRFTKAVHWAHLDIAGTGAIMFGNGERYASGRPVSLLTQFLMDQVNDNDN